MRSKRYVWIWEYTGVKGDWIPGDDSFTTKKGASYRLSAERKHWKEVTGDPNASVRIVKYVAEAELNAK
jgi:hypothetical protein